MMKTGQKKLPGSVFNGWKVKGEEMTNVKGDEMTKKGRQKFWEMKWKT